MGVEQLALGRSIDPHIAIDLALVVVGDVELVDAVAVEVGEDGGVSNRVIAYYEQDDSQPPGAMLVDLANALGVTTDELLGVKTLKDKPDPKAARLVKRLQRIERLPPADRRTVLKFLDALLESKGLAGESSPQT